MLNHLILDNFKAWQKVDLTFGKVTGFFGTNSAGKSSLLQFLLMLKQTRNATDRRVVLDFGGESDFVSLGTFSDIIHHHDKAKSLRWCLDWTMPGPLNLEEWGGPAIHSDRLTTECEVGMRKKCLQCLDLTYRYNDVEFRLRSNRRNVESFKLDANNTDFSFLWTQGRPPSLPKPIKTHLFPNQVRNSCQNVDFLSEFELAYEKLMDSIYYLGPLREHPRRDYHWPGSSPVDVGQRGERTVDAILAATRDGERRRLKPSGRGVRTKTFQEIIAHWMKELGLIRDFRIEEISRGTNLYRAMLKTSPSAADTALPDVGFGVSQVLPALVLLYYVPEGATVLMEQPEIHLHPAVQSGLADLMLNVADVRNLQIIVESHSEHLMRRLQRRVAEQQASAEDVKLYFVSSRRGRAYAADLQLNDCGEIENWPDKFFGDEMGEMAAIAKGALMRRMGQHT